MFFFACSLLNVFSPCWELLPACSLLKALLIHSSPGEEGADGWITLQPPELPGSSHSPLGNSLLVTEHVSVSPVELLTSLRSNVTHVGLKTCG